MQAALLIHYIIAVEGDHIRTVKVSCTKYGVFGNFNRTCR
jgi:hypothetical protein